MDLNNLRYFSKESQRYFAEHASYVAKVDRGTLRKSGYAVLHKMAGKSTDYWKYLTKAQAEQVSRLLPNAQIEKLTPTEMKAKGWYHSEVPAIDYSKTWAVDYEDEDGEDTAKFNSLESASNWIEAQEARRSSGEKFRVLKGPYEVKE